jgi:DNA primase catalytic core
MTFFGPEQVEQVKAATDLVRVAERYVEGMKRAGEHYTARCCFHAERSASMYLYPRDGHYHCFGCGAHGDVISLVQQRDNLSFQEAVERLAREFGVQLEDRASAGPKEDHSGLYRACEFAAAFYEEQLWGDAGEEGLAYLAARRLTEDTIRRFRLGWAPGFDHLCRAAILQGVHPAELQAAGLAKLKEGGLKDRFYRRVVIPITDARGRPVAFSCRVLPDDALKAKERGHDLPKYVNTDDTPLYHKGATVFNLHRAKSAARRAERLVVFEGGLDVIAADQAGFPEAVAPCGTALTAEQARLLTTTAARHDVYLALDGDAAGQKALATGARQLISAGATVRIATLPLDSDPAELLVEQPTDAAEARATFKALLGSAHPGLRWLVNQAVPDAKASDEPTRLRVLDDVLDLVRGVADQELRELYVEGAALQLKIPASVARRRAGRLSSGGASDSNPPGETPKGVRGFEPPSRYALNETGNAHRFRDRYGEDVRYCHTWGVWLVWLGTHWEIDRTREVERRMTAAIEATCDDEIAAVDVLLDEERAKPDPSFMRIEHLQDQADGLRKWKVKNCNDRSLINSLSRAASLVELGIVDLDLDRDPWLFTVETGTIDLRSGEQTKQKRTDYITRYCPVAYDPEARDERWEHFLSLFTADNGELAEYLQRAAGYSATGVTKEDAVWMFAGGGSNGKSTFTAAIQSLLGSYARPLPFELFLTSHSDKRKWSLAEASQCRLVVCEESEEGRRFNASLVKQVTGGTPIEAERKHGNPFSYLPRFKVWFITNNPPTVSDTDHGFWRRLHLVQCDAIPAKPDRDLKPYLQSDPHARAAILAWLVAGARAYHSQGLAAPESVLQANRAYRHEQDPLRPFLQECCIFEDGAQVPVRELMHAYDRWAEEMKLRTKLSNKAITQRLQNRGVQTDGVWVKSQSAKKSVRGYAGIRLRTEADPQTDSDGPEASPQIADGIRGGSEADGSDDGQTTLDQALGGDQPGGSASDVSVASDSPQIAGHIRGDTNPGSHSGLQPPASDASDHRAPIHAREDPSPSLSQGKERNLTDSAAVPPDATSRGARWRTKPSPDPAEEDPFSDPTPPARGTAPPTREPGADEEEPPWPPPGDADPSNQPQE